MSLVEFSENFKVQQSDPSSPLYTVKSFEELDLKPALLQGIYGMGFNRPSDIQATALPMILADPPQNLIAQSQSGTGKTAAFVLAMLSRVDVKEKYPQCICLSPTFELALQTGEVLKQMAKFCEGIDVIFAISGNTPTRIESQIIVGTPGTVMDWCFELKLFNVKDIKVFVLDEADILIGCQEYSDHSVRVKRAMPPNCQLILFSATFDESVWCSAKKIVPNANTIKVKKEDMTMKNIRQFYKFCESDEEKFLALTYMYGSMTIAQSIIFCQNQKTADWLSREMAKDGHQVSLLSGELSENDRANIIQRFRDGKEKVLITTNVCVRGIDIEQVSIVVNFDLPVTVEGLTDYETYLHRIGRTGRFGKKGVAISLVEKCFMYILQDIEEHFGTKIVQLDTEDLDEVERLCC
ncbi:ATP-dependent RNA helicase DDX25-like isoform X2 [Ranitomeya variabilis]|uniref:ATP-dependent RNA helicase DDX25-like isoform X2 n=1 Tax=Ranitomeya variabilis TaxID=490064 RepID=UPI004055F831